MQECDDCGATLAKGAGFVTVDAILLAVFAQSGIS